MNVQTAIYTVAVHLAPGGGKGGSPGIDSGGIQSWLQDNIVPIMLAILGLVIIGGARKGNLSGNALIALCAVIGLIFIVNPDGVMAGAGALSGVVFGN